MKLQRAEMMAQDLMLHHGLTQQGWRFGWMHATRTMGLCSFTTSTIKVSRPLALLNSEDLVLNTILHEIAHAIAGHHHGHNHVWKALAHSIGCEGDRCVSPDIIQVQTDWQATCKDCGYVFQCARRPSTNRLLGRHGSCSSKPNKGTLNWKYKGAEYSLKGLSLLSAIRYGTKV